MKKKIFKGTIGGFIVAIFFISIFAIMNYILYNTTELERLVSLNRIYGKTNTRSGNAVVNIYSISERLGGTDDGKRSIYLVEADNSFAILEVDTNDEDIPKIANNLPYKKAVKIELSKSGKVFDFVSGFNWDESFKAKIDKNIYLSSYSLKKELKSVRIGSFLFLGLGILFLGMGIYRVVKNKSSYERLFNKYEELEKDLNLLVTNSDYFNPVMGLAVYKDYLVGFGLSFDVIDLKEVRKIQYILHTTRSGFTKNRKYYFKITDSDGKINKLFFKKNGSFGNETDVKVGELYHVIGSKFPNIEF